MAKSIPPVQLLDFGGVVTSGHPLRRPPNSASRCDNFRIMPGGFLRLRGGRVIVHDGSVGQFNQFHQFQRADGIGTIQALASYVNGGTTKWQRFTPFSLLTLVDVETLGPTSSASAMLAISNVRNHCFFFNGQGIIGGGGSKPALSSWDGTQVRYVGLDAYHPSGNPTASFAIGAGNNNITTSRTFYVGLYNSATGHFSNGVSAGTISTPGAGTITISNLTRITSIYHDANEQAELFYVFYSSLDGGQTPYLIMDATGLVPLTSPIGTASRTLSIVPTEPAGFIIDVTQEMPTENFPPRPMSHIVFANGRMYGILQSGGTGNPYAMQTRESPKVVWSAAADDIQDRDFVGLPEESWPLRNGKYTPYGDQPIYIARGPNETNVLVLTKKGTFVLEETADGLHEWTTISATDGIGHPQSYAQTPYGSMWLTQKSELVILRPGRAQLEVLSDGFQALIPDGFVGAPFGPTAADYIASPVHQIDQYQIFFSNQTKLVYDFYMTQRLGYGVAYTGSSQDFSAAKTITDANDMRFHFVAKAKIWTHEVDPFFNLVPMRDQTGASTWAEVNGDYIGQWMDFGDSDIRKEINEFDVVGDAAVSAQLGVTPLTMRTYADLTDTVTTPTVTKTAQSTTDHSYRGKIPSPNRMWFKFRALLAGHASDVVVGAGQRYYDAPSTTGELVPPVYGCIWIARNTVSALGENRL